VERYQSDLMSLVWRDHWDVAFLLDVIEHLPDDLEALRQARAALKPGGLLFVTTPAFQQFWSYNDDLAHHLRRYTRADFARLGKQAGLQLCDARYFMFLLSPRYWLARLGNWSKGMTDAQKQTLMHKAHQVPSAPLNLALTAIFAAETPLGHWLRFPWGTSVLGVFRK
jgi:SAM-dependent methyltransferase